LEREMKWMSSILSTAMALFDPQIQQIAMAIVKGLDRAGIDFGILGPRESDSAHQVRRLGEEGLFQFFNGGEYRGI